MDETNILYITHIQILVNKKATNLLFLILEVSEAINDAGVKGHILSDGSICIHYMTKSLRTPDQHIHVLLNILFQMSSPFAVIITFTHLGRLSTRVWSMVVGICPISHKIISEVQHSWRRRPGTQSAFQLIAKVIKSSVHTTHVLPHHPSEILSL